MLCTTASLVDEARAARRGIAAFNVITIEHAEAVAVASATLGLPAIVQISQNAIRYHGGLHALAAAVLSIAVNSEAKLSLHLDHIEDLDLLRANVDCGASSVMFDASRLVDAENIAATRAAAEWAHANRLWIESELGEIGGKGSAHNPGARTDPADAARFVAATGVDALAVAVGSSHAMVSRTAEIDANLVAQIAGVVPVPLVLHGSSGVSLSSLEAAIDAGITKVNVGTLLNIAFTDSVREALGRDSALVDPRRYLAPAREAVTAAVISTMHGIARSEVRH